MILYITLSLASPMPRTGKIAAGIVGGAAVTGGGTAVIHSFNDPHEEIPGSSNLDGSGNRVPMTAVELINAISVMSKEQLALLIPSFKSNFSPPVEQGMQGGESGTAQQLSDQTFSDNPASFSSLK